MARKPSPFHHVSPIGYISSRVASRMLGIPREKIWQAIHRGKLHARRTRNGSMWIRESEVIEMLSASAVPVSTVPMVRSDRPTSSHYPFNLKAAKEFGFRVEKTVPGAKKR